MQDTDGSFSGILGKKKIHNDIISRMEELQI